MQDYFTDKTVLITGGTGSFGRTLARRLLAANTVRKLIIFSRDEWKQWEMRHSDPLFDHPKIRFFLGDVRDAERLVRAFNEVDIVVHAAALKQVPAAEYNPAEFVKTNILGAMNVVDAAIEAGVRQVIALSSDKAVNPTNLYGATKLCSDKLLIAGTSYVGRRGYPTFSVVRYGNVLGSRGSLLMYWKRLLDSGARELPVTDERMTRFWITLEQTVDFVCMALEHMRGRETFIPKSASLPITTLAKAYAPQVPIALCGIRPGEKIHEQLLSSDESPHAWECGDHYVLLPADDTRTPEGAQKLPAGFVLASNTNPLYTDNLEQVKAMLASLPPEMRPDA